jgi:hypothetical protein
VSGGAGAARVRLTWPIVVSLCVIGLLAGGGLLLATDRGTQATATPPTPTTSPGPPPLEQAQLRGSYRVRLVVRTARNLASIAGIDRPVPGSRRVGRWRFFAMCEPDGTAVACPASWGGREGLLVPQAATWLGTVIGPRAACFGATRVPGPIELHLDARDAVMDGGAWVVRSFVGTWAVTFRCPGFAISRGTVEVSGSRLPS